MNAPEGFSTYTNEIQPGWRAWMYAGSRGWRACAVQSVEVLPSGNVRITHEFGRLECGPIEPIQASP